MSAQQRLNLLVFRPGRRHAHGPELKLGLARALEALGNGFSPHKALSALLRAGELDALDRQIEQHEHARVAVERTLAERPAGMIADARDRAEISVAAAEGDLSPVDPDFPQRPVVERIDRAEIEPSFVRHAPSLSQLYGRRRPAGFDRGKKFSFATSRIA